MAISRYLSKNELGKIIKVSKLSLRHLPSEKRWISKWGRLSSSLNRDYYRVYSHYIGEDEDIVPDDLCHNIVEHILNPNSLRALSEDKNLFDLFLSTGFDSFVTPATVLRCMDGVYLDRDYKTINDIDSYIKEIASERLVIKPSIGSSSGRGIIFFTKADCGRFVQRGESGVLSGQYIRDNLPNNFVIQEYLDQSSFMSSFCPTSINTLRIATYRSVKTNEPDVLNCLMRIGSKGSLVDNAHAGGSFVGVSSEGKLGNYLCNQYGEKITCFNGIDFENNTFVIPGFEEIKEFAKQVALCVPHMRLLQLDIAIDKNNRPRLIEYNISGFAPWVYQFTIGPAFGKYTDEIINYCVGHKEEATRIVVTF
ncbi:MAG: hypothetical protein LIR46_05130 [Bacteroidota bacterium]|nr:hypothetical protein [Bacteroidota bacterium]